MKGLDFCGVQMISGASSALNTWRALGLDAKV